MPVNACNTKPNLLYQYLNLSQHQKRVDANTRIPEQNKHYHFNHQYYGMGLINFKRYALRNG